MKKSIDEIFKQRREIMEEMKNITEEYRNKMDSLNSKYISMQNSCPHPSDAHHKIIKNEHGMEIKTIICTLCNSEIFRQSPNNWGSIL